MQRLAYMSFLAVLLAILLSASAGATTLVNDKTHPIPAKKLIALQKAVDRSQIPTIPGNIVISGQATEGVGCGLAGDHYIELECLDGFSILHELAHESQMFMGPGSTLWAGENFGAGAVGWSDQKIRSLARLLGIKPQRERLAEVTADASAVCGLYGDKWRRWWGHYIKRTRKVTVWASTPTPYDFEAGPKQYAKICAALRTP